MSTNIDPKKTKQKTKIPCPCINCLNHYSLPLDEVDHHLFNKGIDPNYTRWIKHGEKDEPVKNVLHTEYFDTEIPTDATETIEMVNATEDNFTEDYEKLQELLVDAEKPLYKGCPNFTKLSALVQLVNLKSKHGVSDKCFTELLVLLKKMLPEGNEMVNNTYEAKKTMKAMGSGYTRIHVCINDCILYRKEYKDLVVCPTCGKSRWKVDENTKIMYENIPAKVMWYFPIIPRLKRLFQAKSIAKDLLWHATSSKKPGVLRHPSDSPAWQAIDNQFPEIADDPRNLRLGISTDGVDVNRGNRNHSVWPVLAVIYNLPPWLCMKRRFIMLSVLISGTPGNDIDVFLDPLIDDLQLLFEEGVETYDAYAQEKFILRAVVLWTINDYPALGTLCGCPYSGFHGCVVCRKETQCCRLPFSSKQSYAGHRRYLPYNHPFRKQTKAFNGKQEWGTTTNPMTGEEIFNEVKYVKNIWGKGFKDKVSGILETSTGRGGKTIKRKRNTSKECDSSNSGHKEPTYWKKFNIWYRRLRYWRYNCVQHCIDFMHIEKNVAESIVGTLLNVPGKTKDGLNARLDLAHFGLKQELQAKKQGNKTILPAACYTLTKDEKDKFCETLYNLRVPQGYCSNFSSLVNRKDRKLVGLKSHDYHMLMQQFLPIAIRSIMPEPTRYAIIRFCFFFKSICSKEIRVEELDKLQEELCVTLCLLEKYFPPSFFDIMIHLTVHLTREVKLCGPICFRWMYPFERCMKVIKGHVRNKTYPEGCIAEENIAEETIEFFSEYQKNMKTIGIPPYKYKTSENDNGEGNPLSAGKPVLVSPELFLKAHFYVLQNTPEIVPYIEQHMTFLKNRHGGKPQAWLEKEHNTTFGHWLRNKVEKELAVSTESISETVKWISHGAHSNVLKYDVYEINGYTFRTKARDGGVYQNSGVGVEATDMHISKEVVTYRKNFYYGVLREIWVLDYHIKRIPLFLCDWVENRNGVKQDSLGYTLVELNKLGHKDDPFILASQARQVFYVKDQLDKKMSIVFMTPPKNYRDSYDDVDEEFSTVIFPHNDNILPRVDPLDMGNESRDDYYRTDCNGIVLRNAD
ncbi:uncharacterized protein LOC110942026 [Helianthus annuus]|nr:uncharacterized protein LOC110942026 [Helianthus annuus]XP_035831438.1 uncharacterized protein LOC110942026 [Helianthus annuus]XP_035831439.1 uncharacterized protein LOC110942026 [Helianthus annuus]